MSISLEGFINSLNEIGKCVWASKTTLVIHYVKDITKHVPQSPGVYWLETTMPLEKLQNAAARTLKIEKKRVRRKQPPGAAIIKQVNADWYVVYSGTDDNLQKRLKEHLLNQGHEDTGKLGCIFNRKPFSRYGWRVSFAIIEPLDVRYSIEVWWRYRIGWPPFCIR